MSDDPRELPLVVDGVECTLRVCRGPSGLRGQVFHGDEKLAGYRIYHSDDVDRMRSQVMRDRAFRRAVARLSGGASEGEA